MTPAALAHRRPLLVGEGFSWSLRASSSAAYIARVRDLGLECIHHGEAGSSVACLCDAVAYTVSARTEAEAMGPWGGDARNAFVCSHTQVEWCCGAPSERLSRANSVRLYPAGTCSLRWRQRSYAVGPCTWPSCGLRASLVISLIQELYYWCSTEKLAKS